MPLRRQIRSNSTSAGRGLPNLPVNCLPLSDNTCCGQPNSRSACTNAVHTARAVARGTTAAMTQYREWSSIAGDHLQLPPVGQEAGPDDVQLPEFHRGVPLPPLVLAAPPASGLDGEQVEADQDPVDRRPVRQPEGAVGELGPFGQLGPDPPRTPPRMRPAHLADQRLDLRRPAMVRTSAASTDPPAPPGRRTGSGSSIGAPPAGTPRSVEPRPRPGRRPGPPALPDTAAP